MKGDAAVEYTVQNLAKLAGVSARTLRYYDRIGLLHSAHIRPNGYRVYGEAEVDRLQQILFYRELDVPLRDIGGILSDPAFDTAEALKTHRSALLEKRARLDAIIKNVENTIRNNERGITMSDHEKFEGFKQKLIDENELKYGEEIREKYGAERIAASNAQFKNLTQEQFDEMQALSGDILKLLDEAFPSGDPACEKAQQMAALHRKWLSFTWESYSPEAHAGLAQMYADDERFAAYYDRGEKGKAAFMRDAIMAYTARAL